MQLIHVLTAAVLVGCTSGHPVGPDTTTDTDASVDLDAASDASSSPPHGYIGAYKSPSIVRDGAAYHAFFAADRVAGARANAPHATFTADGNWAYVGDALPHLGAQAFEGPGNFTVWAPGVAQIDATHWVLYYTAQLAGTVEKKCIWRAHAATADGPFVDDFTGPIECPDASLWAIDAYLVKDAQGSWHLVARIDQPGGINTIQIRALNAEATQFAAGSAWTVLTQNHPESWEQPVMENAGMVRLAPPSGPAHWFVFYSGGAWDNNSYGVGYADCGTGINGPCTKRTPDGPWLGTKPADGVFGPGTPTFYKSETGEQMMSVQAWQYTGGQTNPQNDKGQIMRTYRITLSASYVPTATLVRVDK